MKFFSFAILLLGATLSCPAFEWQTATPESQGLSSGKLKALKDSLAARKTKALLVIRNDRIVCEWYAPGHGVDQKHYTASMAKAIVGGLSLGVALSDGRLALDDPAAKYIPQWRDDPRKSKITLRQLGSHTSGIEDAEADTLPHNQLTGWKGDFWKQPAPPRDPFTLARDAAPVLFAPGEKMQYSNPGIAMLAWCVTAALRDAPQKDIRSLLRERVMRPIGVPDNEWAAGYGTTCTVDGLPLIGTWGGGSYTARAVARIGRLMLREGNWDGRQLLSRAAIRAVTSDAGTPGNCGIGWWSNSEGLYAKLPKDAFWGAGAGHQVVLVVPSLDLIAVRNGDLLAPGAEYHAALHDHFFVPVMDTVQEPPKTSAAKAPAAAPYSPSPVIKSIEWAPKESIRRAAKDSDRFPITWADDDAQYTAWGDGKGFGRTGQKLSLGYARVSGPPEDFAAEDIRSATGEDLGDGLRGLKASGMLSVGGTLYLWASNADKNGSQSRLGWSSDHARTWTWADWRFAEFGYISLVNFGRDYAGARDKFIYAVAHDHPKAYVPADRFILMRAPKERLRERAAYEFFARLGDDGQPVWTGDIRGRGAMFVHPGACQRQQMTYCAPLRRYLWWQQLPTMAKPADLGDTRFEGGFAIYDAPEPWGPWTTAFFTDKWDVGPGETASFPPKWMNADGRKLSLVFSGDDSFSVRQAKIILQENSGN